MEMYVLSQGDQYEIYGRQSDSMAGFSLSIASLHFTVTCQVCSRLDQPAYFQSFGCRV